MKTLIAGIRLFLKRETIRELILEYRKQTVIKKRVEFVSFGKMRQFDRNPGYWGHGTVAIWRDPETGTEYISDMYKTISGEVLSASRKERSSLMYPAGTFETREKLLSDPDVSWIRAFA